MGSQGQAWQLECSQVKYIIYVGVLWILLSMGGGIEQYLKGSPLYPSKQRHVGKWFTTWHSAFWPQVPGQGSWHLFLIHALFHAQSELYMHSGRQPSYGFPT